MMEWPQLIDAAGSALGRFLDIVFARNDAANVWQAMGYTFAAFAGTYILIVNSIRIGIRYVKVEVIDRRPLRPGQVRKEVLTSMVSILMFSVLSGSTFVALRYGWLDVAGAVSVHRWFIEVVVLMLWNEIHFYGMHRLLHTKTLYSRVHAEHHRSIVVTPCACWRFHWLEALLLAAVMPLAMIFHTFSVWSLLMLPPLSLFWNTVGHSNIKPKHRLLAWLATASEHHATHHRLVKGNYGFSLPYLDRWLGTRAG